MCRSTQRLRAGCFLAARLKDRRMLPREQGVTGSLHLVGAWAGWTRWLFECRRATNKQPGQTLDSRACRSGSQSTGLTQVSAAKHRLSGWCQHPSMANPEAVNKAFLLLDVFVNRDTVGPAREACIVSIAQPSASNQRAPSARPNGQY